MIYKYIPLNFTKLQNHFKRENKLGTNKLDSCRIDVKKKERTKMAKEIDDIRDIIDNQKKQESLDKPKNKNRLLAFCLLMLLVVIYLFLS